jgi:hypothetical protein
MQIKTLIVALLASANLVAVAYAQPSEVCLTKTITGTPLANPMCFTPETMSPTTGGGFVLEPVVEPEPVDPVEPVEPVDPVDPVTEVPATPLEPATPLPGVKSGQIEFRNAIDRGIFQAAHRAIGGGDPVISFNSQPLPFSIGGIPRGTVVTGIVSNQGHYNIRVITP